MPKIIILNGPPKSGKDTAANLIEKYFSTNICKHVKFSMPLKQLASAYLGMTEEHLENNKNEILTGNKLSYRDAQIAAFTQLAPIYGEDWLGRCLVNKIKQLEQPFFITSDGGRTNEILPLIRHFGSSNILILQIMRQGCTFAGDIRTYVSFSSVKTIPIINDNLDTFIQNVISLAEDFFIENF